MDASVTEDNFDLSFQNGFSDGNDSTEFTVRFKITVASIQGYVLDLVYVSEFITDEPITDKFTASPFPIVNAPAIAYPYLRSFVSLLILNSGFDPIVLPTVNFQELLKKRKND